MTCTAPTPDWGRELRKPTVQSTPEILRIRIDSSATGGDGVSQNQAPTVQRSGLFRLDCLRLLPTFQSESEACGSRPPPTPHQPWSRAPFPTCHMPDHRRDLRSCSLWRKGVSQTGHAGSQSPRESQRLAISPRDHLASLKVQRVAPSPSSSTPPFPAVPSPLSRRTTVPLHWLRLA
jgi:hypothetical protein